MKNEISPLLTVRKDFDILNGISCYNVDSAEDENMYHRLRYIVYVDEMGFLPRESYQNGLEYDLYDELGRSVAFIATRPIIGPCSAERGSVEILGCLRLILGGRVSTLPCLQHLESNPVNIEGNSAEISRLIVAPNFRNHYSKDIIKLLTWQVRSFCMINNISYCLAAMEVSTFHLLKRMGFPFQQIGPVGDYLGNVIPTILTLNDVLKKDVVNKVWGNI